MSLIRFYLCGALILGLLAGACSGPEQDWPPPGWADFELGGPLPGLTEAELTRWQAGYEQFTRIFTPEEGLGPAFNENACHACHSDPVTGGTMPEPDYHATAQYGDNCDYLAEEGGGNLRKQMTPEGQAVFGVRKEPRPPEATHFGRFNPSVLFGRGMIAAIPEEVILALEDPDDADGDGISGRAGRYPDGTVARFFHKAELATLHEIAAKGLRRQLGLTTPNYPDEHPVMGHPVPAEADPVPDPEVGPEIAEALTDYMMFLAPPPHAVPITEEGRADVARGRAAFLQAGCADCHTEVLYTGPNEVEALNGKPVYLYSDLLLHDMGPELADACGRDAAPSELRTEPLFGVRYKDGWMHHGRAPTLRRAIEMHGGESAFSLGLFQALPPLDQEALIHFLRTL